jgi:hypothetical protein
MANTEFYGDLNSEIFSPQLVLQAKMVGRKIFLGLFNFRIRSAVA